MAGNDRVTDTTEVGATELASVLGITARRVQQLGQDGTFVAVRRGKYLLADSVQRYINFLSKPAIDAEDQKAEKARRLAEMQIKAAKATVAKLEAEELKGNMHRSEDVADMMEDFAFAVRASLNALPGRLAVDAAAAETPAEVSDIIRKEVYKVMTELSAYRYDPAKFEERVRDRRRWAALERDEDGS